MERLRKEGSKLVYRCGKQRSEPTSDKRGAKVDELHLTPLELIDRIAALVPPPRTHRHRYFGVLAPNSPLVSSIQTVAVEFDCRKGSQTGPCSLVAAGVFEPVPEYRTHGHRAGLH